MGLVHSDSRSVENHKAQAPKSGKVLKGNVTWMTGPLPSLVEVTRAEPIIRVVEST